MRVRFLCMLVIHEHTKDLLSADELGTIGLTPSKSPLRKDQMSVSLVEATRELRDDLDSFIEIAKHSRAPIRAVCLIERARRDLQAYLDEIDQAELSSAWSGLG